MRASRSRPPSTLTTAPSDPGRAPLLARPVGEDAGQVEHHPRLRNRERAPAPEPGPGAARMAQAVADLARAQGEPDGQVVQDRPRRVFQLVDKLVAKGQVASPRRHLVRVSEGVPVVDSPCWSDPAPEARPPPSPATAPPPALASNTRTK